MSAPTPGDMSRTPSTSSNSTDITTPLESYDGAKAELLSSNAAFKRWRPSFHLQAPSGWMNDPCAPAFDYKTGLYHVSYQSGSDLKNSDWGHIAWRSATSPDLVSWTIKASPTISPDTPYDCKGVFTGCMLPGQEDGTLTCVYTSVSALPIHHTLPHPKGSESLSMAESIDGGKTWNKFEGNPVLPGEPTELDVTGWRDPFVSHWSGMAKFLGLPESSLFGIISGGIRGVTPTTFLYSIDAQNSTAWHYLGPLVNLGLNAHFSRWSADLGENWEVTNFMTLKDELNPSVKREILIMGTEGCLPNSSSHLKSDPSAAAQAPGPSRPNRCQLWMSGTIKPGQRSGAATSSPVQMKYDTGGYLDHGCFYAANSFLDPKTSKHIVWGWITEDDLCDELRHAQGWSGMLSLPREIRLQTIQNVLCAWKSELRTVTSIECEKNVDGTANVRTLANEPVQSVIETLRRDAAIRRGGQGRQLSSSKAHDVYFTSDDVSTTAWELDCSFRVSMGCSKIGVQLIHSKDFFRTTTLSFDPCGETFTIERPSLPTADSHTLINSAPEVAPHTLFTVRDPTSREEQTEPLRIRAWRDNSVLEVFVNGRTAISTRLYAAEETFGIRFFSDDAEPLPVEFGACSRDPSALLEANLWDGIGVPGSGF